MKKRKLKVLYILLTVTLAFLIALTGMFVPKLLLNTKAKKLATATGRMDNGDVSPYTYTMDTKTRIAKVEKLVEQIFISGADMYINVRDPLDTELSCEQAQRTIKKFLIAYADMLELASQGAQVLHNRSVELAKKYHVNMEVVSSLENVPGTKVKEVVKVEKTNIGGVAKMDNFARFSLVGLEDRPGVAFKVFSLLSRSSVNVDIILQSVGRSGSKDISFTCPMSSIEDAKNVLEENRDAIGYDSIEIDDNVAKISLVGAGMMTHVGVASDMFEALYDAGINIQMIATSEIRISVLVNKDEANRAIKVVHDKFFGNED